MKLETNHIEDQKTLLISIEGNFSFDLLPFINELSPTPNIETYLFDFLLCTNIDSSGLGLLLKLRDKVANQASIKIINCSHQVMKIFEVFQFNHLFPIKACK